MNRKEREENPTDSFDGGYHLMAHQKHAERVSKTPERIQYAIRQFDAHGIEHVLKNPSIGHFHCYRKSDGCMFQFWAGTGKILGVDNQRGIHALITICDDV